MTDLEAMKARKSARTYFTTPVETRKVKALQQMIDQINQDDSLHFLLVREGGQQAFNNMDISYGLFTNVHTLIALMGSKGDHLSQEKAGYFGEQLVLQAVKLGLDTCWVGAAFDRKSPVFAIPEGMEIHCVLTLGYAAGETQYKQELLKKLLVSTQKADWYTAQSEPPDWFLQGIRGAKLAPSALNRQPVSFTYSPAQVTAHIDPEIDFDWIDLGIAKYHFELLAGGKFSWGNDGTFQKN